MSDYVNLLRRDDHIEYGDVIAVGDIHGRFDLFEQFLNYVRGSLACVILLGDIVDRGGDDLRVVEKVKQLLDDPESEGLSNFFCLYGNHEDMLVNAVEGNSEDLFLWLQNGGNFEQFGELSEHVEWIADLPIYMTVGDTMFIHAGFFPGKNPLETLESGRGDSLLWMREPFLSEGPQFEKWTEELSQVIFGHTPRDRNPYTIPSGICIDTAAFETGVLTSYNVTQDTFNQFVIPTDAQETTSD